MEARAVCAAEFGGRSFRASNPAGVLSDHALAIREAFRPRRDFLASIFRLIVAPPSKPAGTCRAFSSELAQRAWNFSAVSIFHDINVFMFLTPE